MRAAALLVVAACQQDPYTPYLSSVDPISAQHGAVVTIYGSLLCGPSSNCTNAGGEIQIGLDPPVVQAVIDNYTAYNVEITIPTAAPVGKTSLVLTVDGRSSNALAFEVLP